MKERLRAEGIGMIKDVKLVELKARSTTAVLVKMIRADDPHFTKSARSTSSATSGGEGTDLYALASSSETVRDYVTSKSLACQTRPKIKTSLSASTAWSRCKTRRTW